MTLIPSFLFLKMYCSLGIWPACNYEHILWILHCSNGSCSKDQFLPGLPQVDDVDPILPLLEDVLLHRGFTVVRSDVSGRSQHLGDVIFLKVIANASSPPDIIKSRFYFLVTEKTCSHSH